MDHIVRLIGEFGLLAVFLNALRSGSLQRRWAGHVETGNTSHSDPAIGMT
jgi:hypothetical protein